MNTENLNVIDLGQAKVKLQLKQKEEQFKNYLSSLPQEQLQYEANYLLNKANNGLDEQTLMKSALLMDELAKRVSADKMSDTISTYAEQLRKKADKNDNPDQL